METLPALRKVIAKNNKAKFNYFIEETYEAGIMLVGSEVKSMREGKISIIDAFVQEVDGELFLVKSMINPIANSKIFNHEPERPRKLLMHKKEIKRLMGKIKTKGYTLIALSVYFNDKNKIKVELGLGYGKKLHDKRETEKNRDWEREKSKAMKDKRND